jgi:hypothetical protein
VPIVAEQIRIHDLPALKARQYRAAQILLYLAPLAGLKTEDILMDLPLSAANLSFVLCGLILVLGTLLIWAIQSADRWIALKRPVWIRRRRE